MKGYLSYRDEYDCGCDVKYYHTKVIGYRTKGLFKITRYMDYYYYCVNCGEISQTFTAQIGKDGQIVNETPGVGQSL